MEVRRIKEWSDGLTCPKCGCPRLSVDYTRHGAGGIKRVRSCDLCGKRFTTFEKTLGPPPKHLGTGIWAG